MDISILLDSLLALFTLIFIGRLLFDATLGGTGNDFQLGQHSYERGKQSLLNQRVMRRPVLH